MLAAFGLDGPALLLPGGEGRSFRVGDAVLRRENREDIARVPWLADLFDRIPARGCRVARPLRTGAGGWLAPGGWSAWRFVTGRPATAADAPTVLAAIEAFHAALAPEPCPPWLPRRDSPYDRADRWAWSDLPPAIDPPFADPVRRLAALRRPVHGLTGQLIHGDLNPENVLIAPGLPPAIIDMAAYWRPAPFAAAIAAYWLGPYRGDAAVLHQFERVPQFDQLLVRAGLRMLLSAWLWRHTQDIGAYVQATDIICARMGEP